MLWSYSDNKICMDAQTDAQTTQKHNDWSLQVGRDIKKCDVSMAEMKFQKTCVSHSGPVLLQIIDTFTAV